MNLELFEAVASFSLAQPTFKYQGLHLSTIPRIAGASACFVNDDSRSDESGTGTVD